MNELIFLGFGPLLQAQSKGGLPTTLLPLLLIVLVFYMFMIRPQQRRQKEQRNRAETLKKGDKVVTIGGVHGLVTDLHEKTVVVKTGRDSHIEFSRSAISTVVNPQAATAQPTVQPRRFSLFNRKKEETTNVDPGEGKA